MGKKLAFGSDYMLGAHPEVLDALVRTNMEATDGYGYDEYSIAAREKVREACGTPDAIVEFLVGGTQTNATVIDALLRKYQAAIAIESGHIATHESGAIEALGHKVVTLPGQEGKMVPEVLEEYLSVYFGAEGYQHMAVPGMVYITHPTEYGTMYTKEEMAKIYDLCKQYDLLLYVDGARLAYALASPDNDISLKKLATLCDAFYIGGTKCGALFGEAVVIPDPSLVKHFFAIIKQHGALMAKGRIIALQYDALFTKDENGKYLYDKVGETAVNAAEKIQDAWEAKGGKLQFRSPTNQMFFVVPNELIPTLEEKIICSVWEPYDETHTVIRLVAGWGTTEEDVQGVLDVFASLEGIGIKTYPQQKLAIHA